MSEEKESHEELIEMIRPEAIVNVKCSVTYFNAMKSVLMGIISGKTEADMTAANEQIRSEKVTEAWVEHYQTILIFLHSFQEEATASGQTQHHTQEEARIIREEANR
jgi:hypothetical protein